MKLAFISKSCTSNTGFINIDAINLVVSSFKEILQINDCEGCEYINDNLSNSNLTTPSEMFLYLVKCSENLNPWFRFYENIFQNQSSDHMVLTINKVLKRTKGNHEDLYDIAAKIFNNLNTLFSLKLKTPQKLTEGIEDLSQQNDSNTLSRIAGINELLLH